MPRPRFKAISIFVFLPLVPACVESGGDPPVAESARPLCVAARAGDVDRSIVRDGARLLATGRLGCADATQPEAEVIATVRALRYEGPGWVDRAAAVAEADLDYHVVERTTDGLGRALWRVDQIAYGLPVAAGRLVVHVLPSSGQIAAVAGSEAWPSERPTEARVDGLTALSAAAADLAGTVVDAPALGYVALGDGRTPLVYSALVAHQSVDGPELDRVFVSATTGAVVARHPQIHRALNRRIHTANNGQTLPGTLVFQEGGTSNDASAKAAYDNAGLTYTFFKDAFARDSWNGQGAAIVSTVHFDQNYNNAFWNGTQMVYGDGDGVDFNSFALSLDVVAHEISHAVTQSTADLVYQNESGALNEAMSDIMGVAAGVARDKGVISAATWLLGEDIFTPNTPGDALRYLDNPSKDGISPDLYAERYTGTQDNGGVHINSGLANLAFQRLVVGGTHPRQKTPFIVPGLGITKAQAIFYRALTTYMTANTNFAGARAATAMAAKDLYGDGAEVAAVHYAWDLVGVPGGPTRAPLVVEIQSPAQGATVSGAVSVTTRLGTGASAFDLERSELLVGGAVNGAPCLAMPCTFSPTGLPAAGSVTVAVRSKDRTGKVSTSPSVTFTLSGSTGPKPPGPPEQDPPGQDPDGPGADDPVGAPPTFCAVAPTGRGSAAPWLGALAIGLALTVANRRRR
jgi:Zn-dependent metalloprotease